MTNPTKLNKVIKERLKDIELALNQSSIVAITDTQGRIQFANDKFCEISKYSREELIGSKQNIVNSGYHDREFFKEMWRTIGTGKVWKGEIRNQAKDGSYYWVDTTIVPFMKENGKPYQYIAIRHDITRLKEYESAIEQMAYYDALTLLPNRYYLKEWIQKDGDADDSITVFFIDVDRFKTVNDSYGHRIGDDVLQEVAKRLESCICLKQHLIIRQGGDEFIVLLKNVSGEAEILQQVHAIFDEFKDPFTLNGQSSQITISIGISMTTKIKQTEDPLKSLEILITEADTAMYHAKRRTGNSFCFNTKDQNEQYSRYCMMEVELSKALLKEELSINYQPIIELKTKKLAGLEALLRWDNEKLGQVSPEEFIPIMEEIGLIKDIGSWVIDQVLRQMGQWKRQGMDIPRIAINVSPLQLKDPNFIHDVIKGLKREKIDPGSLELEITEGSLLHVKESLGLIQRLRREGVRISIDDFGTGYSSLHLLTQLPITTIKIDKSFLEDLDKQGDVIIRTIISMGTNLEVTVVAEGIEREEQLYYLQATDCCEGQGYYFSQALKPEEVQNLIQAKSFDPEDRPAFLVP